MNFQFVDAHSEGAPCRTIIGGLEPLAISGETMLKKKQYFEENCDWLRTALLQEPRGFPAVNADLVVPPCDPTADVGLLILNQRRIGPMMSGGNILCFVTAILEAGVVPIDTANPVTVVRVETAGGICVARARCDGGRVLDVSIENLPSYATHLDFKLPVPGYGEITVDVGYGGMFYAIASASELGLDLVPDNAAEIARVGELIRASAYKHIEVDNPASKSIKTVDAVLIAGAPHSPQNSGRSAVVMPMLSGAPTFASGVHSLIDRCPCGTGTSAQVAVLSAKGKLKLGDVWKQESILDGVYSCRPLRQIEVNGRDGIIPELTGSSHLIARGEIIISDSDPLRHGFKVGDMWAGRVL
ncbi:proline racemase family protein [Paraburkholderia sp. EG285A]|uniref:proline racemase family protein n=1 Tax=Paraburkholderia sp. EG285A TaxID=3237009 RepID=UPI0034D2177F